MSTNSAIGVVVNGKIKACYCHWDGYPEGVGKVLLNHYDQKKAEELVSLGDISSLGPVIGEKHEDKYYELGSTERTWTVFYERDRGEGDCEPEWFDSAEEFLHFFHGEYWYLLGTDGVWYVSQGDMLWKKVTDLL